MNFLECMLLGARPPTVDPPLVDPPLVDPPLVDPSPTMSLEYPLTVPLSLSIVNSLYAIRQKNNDRAVWHCQLVQWFCLVGWF